MEVLKIGKSGVLSLNQLDTLKEQKCAEMYNILIFTQEY